MKHALKFQFWFRPATKDFAWHLKSNGRVVSENAGLNTRRACLDARRTHLNREIKPAEEIAPPTKKSPC